MATKRIVKAVKVRGVSHMWTKEEIALVIDLWETQRTEEIAERIGLAPSQVTYMAGILRKAGYPMAQKHLKGKIYSLIEAVANDRGIKLKK